MEHIVWKETKIYYRKTGSGSPVYLIHGFGEDHTIWNRQVEYLKEHFCIYRPDLPGTGKSGYVEATLDEMSAIILLMMQKEGHDKISLIGHSMGGYLSMAFAKKYPEKITCLGLFHSSAYADDNEKKETRKKAIGFIEENGAQAFLKTTIPSLFHDTEINKEEIERLLSLNLKSETLKAYYSAMIKREDTSGILANLNCPVLFVLGTFDKAVPMEAGLKQSYLPKESHIHILKNSAHMGMLEETAESNKILAEFLQHSVSMVNP